MTLALITTIVLVTIGFLVLLDRKDARASQERDRVIDRLTTEQAAHRKEIAALLQRIQAPELAVAQHAATQAEDIPAGAPPVRDEEFWAEHEEHREYLAKLEQLENAPFDRA